MSKAVRYLLAGCVTMLLLLGAFSGGMVVGWFLPHDNPFQSQTPESQQETVLPKEETQADDTETLFQPFWEAWTLLHQQYVDQPLDDLLLMRGAIRGMLSSLEDPHTSYMDPEEYQQANAPMEGSYEGIGAHVDTTGEYLIITSPMPDSPAEKAGLKSGDKIIQVDGEDMTGVDGNLVLRRVLGPAGSQVKLTILREGSEQPLEVTITRAKIEIKSVTAKMLDNQISYIDLSTFADSTGQDLKTSLEDLLAQKPKGLILDLRNNGGGYLNTAIEVVSQFISDGMVLFEEYGDGTQQGYSAIPGGIATQIPLVVLVNEGTASASEITAGAIQDHGRGTLVGVTTYGKGSVQNWIELKNGQGAVRITIARWLTPEKRQINQIGLEPDIVVENTSEDIASNHDAQLEKAIELLSKGR